MPDNLVETLYASVVGLAHPGMQLHLTQVTIEGTGYWNSKQKLGPGNQSLQ